MGPAKWQSEVRDMLEQKARGGIDEAVFQRFCERMHYHQGDITQAESYSSLAKTLNNSQVFPQNQTFYLAISPLILPIPSNS